VAELQKLNSGGRKRGSTTFRKGGVREYQITSTSRNKHHIASLTQQFSQTQVISMAMAINRQQTIQKRE
jgi:hypothetical protein